MPPRYAYWTILIDGQATAFRARDREELLPTFHQLARKNTDIVMRYFARGRLWDNPEQAQWANRNPEIKRHEQRDRDWRPGAQHKDPRARFDHRGGKAGGTGKTEGARKSRGDAFRPPFERGQDGRDRRAERPKTQWRDRAQSRFKPGPTEGGPGRPAERETHRRGSSRVRPPRKKPQ